MNEQSDRLREVGRDNTKGAKQLICGLPAKTSLAVDRLHLYLICHL
jgi:hypothetical protein